MSGIWPDIIIGLSGPVLINFCFSHAWGRLRNSCSLCLICPTCSCYFFCLRLTHDLY